MSDHLQDPIEGSFVLRTWEQVVIMEQDVHRPRAGGVLLYPRPTVVTVLRIKGVMQHHHDNWLIVCRMEMKRSYVEGQWITAICCTVLKDVNIMVLVWSEHGQILLAAEVSNQGIVL